MQGSSVEEEVGFALGSEHSEHGGRLFGSRSIGLVQLLGKLRLLKIQVFPCLSTAFASGTMQAWEAAIMEGKERRSGS